jgi:hypothetical protein
MKKFLLAIPLLLLPLMAHAESWKVMGKQKNLRTGEEMVNLSQLSRDIAFEDCKTWADGGGDMGLKEGRVSMNGNSMYVLVYESADVTVFCQQVTKKLLQRAIKLPQNRVAEYGLVIGE